MAHKTGRSNHNGTHPPMTLILAQRKAVQPLAASCHICKPLQAETPTDILEMALTLSRGGGCAVSHTFRTRRNGVEGGPYSGAEIRALAEQGLLFKDDEVKREDVDHWFSAGDVRGLFQDGAPPTPASQVQDSLQPVASAEAREHPEGEKLPSLDRSALLLTGGVFLSLVAIAFSSLLPWVRILTGGFSGIRGDGKIVLIVSVCCLGLMALATWKRILLHPFSALCLAWGLAVVGWMGKLVYTIASVADQLKTDVGRASAFSEIVWTQVSPGSGLYVGLMGGMGCGATCAFLILHKASLVSGGGPIRDRRRTWFALGSSLGLIAAIALAIVLGQPGAGAHPSIPRTLAKGDGTREELVDWSSATAPVRHGEVRIESVAVGKVPLVGSLGYGITTQDELLAIKVQLRNVSRSTKIEYHSWMHHDFSMDRDYATLADNFANSYRSTSGFSSETLYLESLYPGKSLSDVLTFERPVGEVEYLDLELPAKNFGGQGMVRVRIPASMITRR
jgi:hypothetical protein